MPANALNRMDLIGLLEDIMIAINAAQRAAQNGDISNVLYNIDHAEVDLQRARNLTVSILHHGER
jgi:hypothetical protein